MSLQPIKCASCGANLTIAPTQVLASCDYCRTGYEVLGTNAVSFSQLAVAAEEKPGLWLPFWLVRFAVIVKDLQVKEPASVFDQAPEPVVLRSQREGLAVSHRMTVSVQVIKSPAPPNGLERAVQDAGGQGDGLAIRRALEDRENTMLVAAFQANNFINYTADLSLAISRLWDERPLAKPAEWMHWPRCYYNHLDARKIAAILLRVMVNKQVTGFVEMDFDTHWKDHRLVWWPFASDGEYWRDMVYGERILKSAIGSEASP